MKGREITFRRTPNSAALEVGLAFFEEGVYGLGVVTG